MRKQTALRTEKQVSAGGLVFRTGPAGAEVALISTGSPARWQLPKGLIDDGETPEAAAIREVREEAGIEAQLVSKLETVEYWYQSRSGGNRVRYHKFVHFYLMRYHSGNVADHDHEVNEARWVSVSEAGSLLAFKSEKALLEKVIARIAAG